MPVWQPRPVETLASYRPWFADTPFGNQVESILLGHTPGQVWDIPGAFYVWDNRFSHYIGATDPDAIPEIRSFYEATIRPAMREGGRKMAKFLTMGEAESPVSGQAVPLIRFATPRTLPMPTGPGQLRLITAEDLREFTEIREEVEGMWGSGDRFLREGFGYYVRLQDRCASWCTAEYLTADSCAVGIATDPGFRRQGFATRAAVAVMNRAVSKGLRIHWDAKAGNEASVALARRLGFEDERPYSAFFSYGEAA